MEMSKNARESRNAYMRKWRAENKEKTKQYNKTFWEKQATKVEQKEQA